MGNGGGGGGGGDRGMGNGNGQGAINKEYEMFDDFSANFGYGGSLLPLFQGSVKPCPKVMGGIEASGQCRAMYMPCKSDLSCAVSCQVNDYHCGKCSDTNSFRKLCQCCTAMGSPPPIK